MYNIRIDARMALANYESSVAAFGKEAHFSIKNVHDVRAYIDHLESALDVYACICPEGLCCEEPCGYIARAALAGEKTNG